MNWFTKREVKTNRMFILDDATPFGIRIPTGLIDIFKSTASVDILDANELTKELYELVPNNYRLTPIGYGGTLVFTLLVQRGFSQPLIPLQVEREYKYQEYGKRPKIVLRVSGNCQWDKEATVNLLDDVIASGMTINACREYLKADVNSTSALILSGGTRGEFRTKDGSTIKNVNYVYASQVVRYEAGFPTIFSVRFLLKKAKEEENYFTYLSKYAGDRVSELRRLLIATNTKPFDLLYTNPKEFLRVYGRRY